MVIDNPLYIKHGGPLPSSYYVLNDLTAILTDQLCYCPRFIEVEIGTKGLSLISKVTQLLNNRTEPRSGCHQRSNALCYSFSNIKGFRRQSAPDISNSGNGLPRRPTGSGIVWIHLTSPTYGIETTAFMSHFKDPLSLIHTYT